MMSMKVNWKKLREAQKELAAIPTLADESEIIFVMILSNGAVKKHVVKFKDFLNFFWVLVDNPNYTVVTLVVQDKEGRILYRHRMLNNGGEEIPIGGNGDVVLNWNTLSENEKNTYIKLTEAQINGYER